MIEMARNFSAILLVATLGSGIPDAAIACEQQRSNQDPKAATAPAGQQEIPRFKWWLHPDTRKELGLSDKQSRKIDEIWEATSPKLREQWHELQKLEDALANMFKENTADVATVQQQVERVERLRAENAATRTVMIYKMYLLLTPEQRPKVEAIRAKLDEERRQRQAEERKREGKIGKY
jgi:Spy/CpxP family protein refolding chaperone